jgi:hypothetical protein
MSPLVYLIPIITQFSKVRQLAFVWLRLVWGPRPSFRPSVAWYEGMNTTDLHEIRYRRTLQKDERSCNVSFFYKKPQSLAYFTSGVFNAWPAGHMWPAEPFAVARRLFWKNNYKR